MFVEPGLSVRYKAERERRGRANDNNGERLEAPGSIMLPDDERNGTVPSVPCLFV